ncbi:hypothetical protein H0E87_017577 [Populus deltoides]|uniref:Uncharacterized protein n=1 Tax=Populus deltoides TaxID=3696 RepID=A0A8T2Y0R2_POPDE|nr:hypothetical protein H0E87_017577 [Populus deltoides]
MAGRNHLQLREIPLSRVAPLPRSTTDPRLLHTRPHHHLLEDRISTQHRDIQSLLLDNQRHAATHVALKQEVSAIEYEKKTRAFNLEQEKVLEKNRILLVREIEKLRTELANAEKRARAAAAAGNPSPGYGRNYGSAEVRYGGSSYPDPNGLQQVQIGGSDSAPTFSSGAMSNGHHDTAHR